MTWVKFHGEIRQGAKRGLPRATRFIFMELCHEARPGRGVIELPLGMGDVDAIQDVLGGNAKEVREAVAKLTVGPEPMLVFEGSEGSRKLLIPSWQRWNAGAVEPAGSSTQRSRRSRAASDERAGNDDAAAMQRSLHADAASDERAGNDRPSGDQSRGEESSSRAAAARGTRPEVDHRDHGPPQRATTMTDDERTVLDALKSSEALRGTATLEFAQRLAKQCAPGSRLALGDVLGAIGQADAKEAARLSVGEPPRERGALATMVAGFVNQATRGAATASAGGAATQPTVDDPKRREQVAAARESMLREKRVALGIEGGSS